MGSMYTKHLETLLGICLVGDIDGFHRYVSSLSVDGITFSEAQINLCLAINGNRRKLNGNERFHREMIALGLPLPVYTTDSEYRVLVPMIVAGKSGISCHLQCRAIWNCVSKILKEERLHMAEVLL